MIIPRLLNCFTTCVCVQIYQYLRVSSLFEYISTSDLRDSLYRRAFYAISYASLLVNWLPEKPVHAVFHN